MAVTRTPKAGDRAAWDSTDFPELHTNEAEILWLHHVPAGNVVGDVLVWNGYEWVSDPFSASLPPIVTLATREGELVVAASPLRVYNKYGADRVITKVFLVVGDAPDGDDLICDVSVDGTSVFTSPNRPTILDGEFTGESTTFDSPTWPADSYLTWEVAQIGSTLPGSNLVVHIVHEKA